MAIRRRPTADSRRTAAAGAMIRVTAVLAKITPPTVRKSIARERVFRLLDDAAAHPVTWLSAPAGYGKTTVIATYLRDRADRPLWYHCDDGDADVASFFYYLVLLFGAAVGAKRLPAVEFSPDYLAAIATFARTFFRSWFAQLPAGTTLVLDDWHEVPATAPAFQLLPLMAEELPPGLRLIVISRLDPGAAFSRLRANGHVMVLSERDLQLSLEETESIAALFGAADQKTRATAQALYAMTRGWAAGLTLTLRRAPDADAWNWHTDRGAAQATFDFLSTEVFDRLDADVREFLLKTACLDYMPPQVAGAVSGNPHALTLLEGLVHDNAFTVYRPESLTFHYHPLFLEFLRARSAAALGEAEQRELLLAAARSFRVFGDIDAAIGFFIRARQWPEALALILEAAPAFVQHGRLQPLSAWIAALPPDVSEGEGWLSYWSGIVQMATDFLNARPTLERAFAQFERAGDTTGQKLAAAAVLQHIHFAFSDFQPMVPWLETLDRLLLVAPRFPSPSMELQVSSGFLLAAAQIDPRHASVRSRIERIYRLIDADVDLPSRAAGVIALMLFFGVYGLTAEYRALEPHLQLILQRPELGPSSRLLIIWLHSYVRYQIGATDESHALLDEALAIAKDHNLMAFELRIHISKLQTMDPSHRTVEMPMALDRLAPTLRHAPPMLVAHWKYVQALYYLDVGRLPEAMRFAAEVAQEFSAARWSSPRCMALIVQAEIYCELGDFDQARECLATCAAEGGGEELPLTEFNRGLVVADVALRCGQTEEFATALGSALAIGRRQEYANLYHTYSQLLQRLIPHALNLGIEVEYCRRLIRNRGFEAPLTDVPLWPCAVRIVTLGRLEVFVDQEPLAFEGKAQRKPMDLLKLLLTQESGVETTVLMDALWPDLDGDAARNAFDLALHRLRKLLRHKEAVSLAHGRLALDGRHVRVDAFVLERMAAQTPAREDLSGGVASLLRQYGGPFLAGDPAPLLYAARDRLRSQFVRMTAALAEQLAAAQRFDLLVALGRQAIEREPLEEGLHRCLIQGLLGLGHAAEAGAASHRYAEMLARLSQRKPSPGLLRPFANSRAT